jgi:hypothetical protein
MRDVHMRSAAAGWLEASFADTPTSSQSRPKSRPVSEHDTFVF